MKTILILDDEKDIHHVFKRCMGEKYKLIHALTLEEAIKECLKEVEIDLIITDIFLENKETGFAFVHKIREMNKIIPMIIMSAYGNQFTSDLIDNIKKTFECHFINKPFNNDEMEQLIEKLLAEK